MAAKRRKGEGARPRRRDRQGSAVPLEWIQPEQVAEPAELRDFFSGPHPTTRASAYFCAARAALVVNVDAECEGTEPALQPGTIREARAAAHALLTDLERVARAAVEAVDPSAPAPRFESARAWSGGHRVRLLHSLVRVVCFVYADADPLLREFLALADAEITGHGGAER